MLRSVTLPPAGASWPFDLPLLHETREVVFDRPATILVGENGSGKSTVLAALALAAELPSVGTVGVPANDPTLAPVRPLADRLRLSWSARTRRGMYFRAEDLFGYVQAEKRRDAEFRAEAERLARDHPDLPEPELRRIQAPWVGPVLARERRYGGDLDRRSHGEAFLALIRSRIVGPGLYLLDEPEAPFSPLRQLALLLILRDAIDRGAQLIVATHAPIVAALPGARILELRDGGLHPTSWDRLEHVDLLRSFLAEPERFLDRLGRA